MVRDRWKQIRGTRSRKVRWRRRNITWWRRREIRWDSGRKIWCITPHNFFNLVFWPYAELTYCHWFIKGIPYRRQEMLKDGFYFFYYYTWELWKLQKCNEGRRDKYCLSGENYMKALKAPEVHWKEKRQILFKWWKLHESNLKNYFFTIFVAFWQCGKFSFFCFIVEIFYVVYFAVF